VTGRQGPCGRDAVSFGREVELDEMDALPQQGGALGEVITVPHLSLVGRREQFQHGHQRSIAAVQNLDVSLADLVINDEWYCHRFQHGGARSG
jgi:hypothetical protein